MIRSIAYDKALYSRDSVYRAREIYLSYGEITIKESADSYDVVFSANADTVDQLIGEFSNYLIYIEASQEL